VPQPSVSLHVEPPIRVYLRNPLREPSAYDHRQSCGASLRCLPRVFLLEWTMSRRPRGKLVKQIHDPAQPDIRKPKQPRNSFRFV
jgi:hypothetical protein